MTTINETGLSKDYNLLCELIKTQAVICVVDKYTVMDKLIRRPCICSINENTHNIWLDETIVNFNEPFFIQECQRLNLAFYNPTLNKPQELRYDLMWSESVREASRTSEKCGYGFINTDGMAILKFLEMAIPYSGDWNVAAKRLSRLVTKEDV